MTYTSKTAEHIKGALRYDIDGNLVGEPKRSNGFILIIGIPKKGYRKSHKAKAVSEGVLLSQGEYVEIGDNRYENNRGRLRVESLRRSLPNEVGYPAHVAWAT